MQYEIVVDGKQGDAMERLRGMKRWRRKETKEAWALMFIEATANLVGEGNRREGEEVVINLTEDGAIATSVQM